MITQQEKLARRLDRAMVGAMVELRLDMVERYKVGQAAKLAGDYESLPGWVQQLLDRAEATGDRRWGNGA